MAHSQRSVRAFTLVELLVVIAIIGILIALLMPAVQAAREAGRRTQCKSNLHQIATAWHLFHDSFGIFPNGGYSWDSPITFQNGVPADPPHQAVGWTYQILPFLELSSVYRNFSDDAAIPGTCNFNQGATSQTIVPTYACPTKRSANPLMSNGRAVSDYAAAIPGVAPPQGATGGALWINGFWAGGDHHGMVARALPLGSHPMINMGAVSDGTSNTIMLSEKWVHPDGYLPGDCAIDFAGWCCGWCPSIVRMTLYPPKQDDRGPPPAGYPFYSTSTQISRYFQGYMFGSAHPVALNVAFGDASVRSIHYEVAPDIWWRAGQRNDGSATKLE